MDNLTDYLKAKGIYSSEDFKISNHQDVYFSISKLKQIVKIDLSIPNKKIKEFGSSEYILISDVIDLVQKINDVRNYWMGEIHKVFGLVKTIKTNGLEILIGIEKLKYSGQFMFTYTLWKFIQDNFPNMTISIEENILERFDSDIIIGRNRGPRVDIVINEIKLVIEFDEIQHGTYEHVEKDEIRDCIIKAYGYNVIRFREKSNPIYFFVNYLKPTIISLELNSNPEMFGENIINYFLKNNIGDREMLELLVKEQTIDIINQVPFKDIGTTPRNIYFNTICSWLNIDINNSEQINKIKNKLEDIDYPYIYIENDIILCPMAYETLINSLDPNEYDILAQLKKCYIDIKNKLLEELYNRILTMNQNEKSRISLLKHISNEAYKRGQKDSQGKFKDLQRKCDDYQIEINTLKNIINETLPKNGRGHIKQNLIEIMSELEINQPIIAEIPELVYTDSYDNFIDELELKVHYEQNKLKYKITESFTSCLNKIKLKLQIQSDNNSSLIENTLFKCKFKYISKLKQAKQIKKILVELDSNSDNDEI